MIKKNHKCDTGINKRVLGQFKDEGNGQIMSEIIALKPKLYAVKVEDNTHKKANGIPKVKAEKRI